MFVLDFFGSYHNLLDTVVQVALLAIVIYTEACYSSQIGCHFTIMLPNGIQPVIVWLN